MLEKLDEMYSLGKILVARHIFIIHICIWIQRYIHPLIQTNDKYIIVYSDEIAIALTTLITPIANRITHRIT